MLVAVRYTRRPLTQSDYTRCCINAVVRGCSKHVEDSDKHIIEEIVRQAGYLPELYEDIRSEKYKMKCFCLEILASRLPANMYDIYHCCVYSEKLLMMDRETPRNT